MKAKRSKKERVISGYPQKLASMSSKKLKKGVARKTPLSLDDLKVLDSTLEEWRSDEDDQAYHNL